MVGDAHISAGHGPATTPLLCLSSVPHALPSPARVPSHSSIRPSMRPSLLMCPRTPSTSALPMPGAFASGASTDSAVSDSCPLFCVLGESGYRAVQIHSSPAPSHVVFVWYVTRLSVLVHLWISDLWTRIPRNSTSSRCTSDLALPLVRSVQDVRSTLPWDSLPSVAFPVQHVPETWIPVSYFTIPVAE